MEHCRNSPWCLLDHRTLSWVNHINCDWKALCVTWGIVPSGDTEMNQMAIAVVRGCIYFQHHYWTCSWTLFILYCSIEKTKIGDRIWNRKKPPEKSQYRTFMFVKWNSLQNSQWTSGVKISIKYILKIHSQQNKKGADTNSTLHMHHESCKVSSPSAFYLSKQESRCAQNVTVFTMHCFKFLRSVPLYTLLKTPPPPPPLKKKTSKPRAKSQRLSAVSWF